MKNFVLFLFVFASMQAIYAQDITKTTEKPFYMDFVMGPYLILDGTIYESVFLRGMRIGYERESGLAYGVEYIAGNQEDLQGQLGTTHSAFFHLKYFFHCHLEIRSKLLRNFFLNNNSLYHRNVLRNQEHRKKA